MESRDASRAIMHLRRAQELLNAQGFGFGQGQYGQKPYDRKNPRNPKPDPSISKESACSDVYFAKQRGGTCYMHAAVGLIVKALSEDWKMFHKHEILSEFRKLMLSNKPLDISDIVLSSTRCVMGKRVMDVYHDLAFRPVQNMNLLANGGREMCMLVAFILTCRYELLKIYGDRDNWRLVKLSLPRDHDDRVEYEDGVQDVPMLYDKRTDQSIKELKCRDEYIVIEHMPIEQIIITKYQDALLLLDDIKRMGLLDRLCGGMITYLGEDCNFDEHHAVMFVKCGPNIQVCNSNETMCRPASVQLGQELHVTTVRYVIAAVDVPLVTPLEVEQHQRYHYMKKQEVEARENIRVTIIYISGRDEWKLYTSKQEDEFGRSTQGKFICTLRDSFVHNNKNSGVYVRDKPQKEIEEQGTENLYFPTPIKDDAVKQLESDHHFAEEVEFRKEKELNTNMNLVLNDEYNTRCVLRSPEVIFYGEVQFERKKYIKIIQMDGIISLKLEENGWKPG